MAGGVGRWSRGGGAGVRGGSWGLPPGERGNGNRVCTGDRFAPAKNRSRPPFMLNGQAPCARSSGAVLRLSCMLRACPALAGTTTSGALSSSAIEGAQHLVRHDRVSDRLPLSRMAVERPRLVCIFATPPLHPLPPDGLAQVLTT